MSTYFPLAGSNAVIPALNPVKVTQLVTNAEFPPAGASNAGAYADYTDVVASIDAGSPMTLAEFPPVGLTSATTTAGPITIPVSGAFYGNGNYVVTASSVFSTTYPPWNAFDKQNGLPWLSSTSYSTTSPYAATSGGPTIVSSISYTGAFLQIQLPTAIILKSYLITPSNSSFTNWIIAGSIDGSTWSLVHSQQNRTWNLGVEILFTTQNTLPFLYYRIIILNAAENTGTVAFREWKLLADIPLPTTAREYPPLPMTANTSYLNGTYGAGTYVASASSVNSPYPEYNAFNKIITGGTAGAWAPVAGSYTNGVQNRNIATFDISQNKYLGEWLQLKMPVQIILTSYNLMPNDGWAPSTWYIFGSSDGIAWRILDSKDAITWSGVSQTFTISNNNYYQYYRIVVNKEISGSSFTGVAASDISEWKLFGTQAAYPKYRTTISSSHTTYNAGTYSTYANTQYNATTVDAAPPLFVADKTLSAPWRTGASNYTIAADASPIPSVFFELPAQIRLASYRMTAPDTSEAPSAWNLYGSNMNVVGGWLLLDARTSVVAPWATSLTQTFSLASPTSAFNFFKVDLLRNCASTAPGDFIALSELRLIGDDVAPESRIAVGADGRVAVNAPPEAVNTSAAMTVGGNLAVNGSIRADNLGMFRNRIINGDMRVDQRLAGTSSNLVATAVGAYIADRWRVSNGTTTGALTVQRVRAPANPYCQVYALSAIATTAQATMNNQDYITLEQRVEGYNIADFGWGGAYAQPVTVSFAAYSTQAGQYTLALRNSANTMSYVAPFTVPAANQWVQIQQTISGETSGAWEVENGLGLSVAVTLAAGSNWVTSDVGRWQESSRAPSGFGYAAATGGVNFMGVANNQFYLTGVQVEKGTIATPFEARPYSMELVLCQRYTERLATPNGSHAMITYTGGGAYNLWFLFKVTKYSAPTLVSGSVNAGTGTISATIFSVDGAFWQISVNASNQGFYVINPTLIFSAEL